MARRRDEEEGFTLIELMVVVLIIAILIAIAIPTFLGARQRAQDRAAQSSLRNALTAAKTVYTDTQDYASATPGSLASVEPSLTYQTTASTTQNQVFVNSSSTTVSMHAQSKSNNCFWIQDNVATGTQYQKVAGVCSTTVPTSGWVTSW
jgi:type IV pilus assembly protein PilA